jgi:hypothetical protein
VTINVPNFPRLQELNTKLQSFKVGVRDCQTRLATLTRENVLLNQQAESASPSQQVFDRLAVLKREIRQAETALAGAQSQAARVEDEWRQWRDQFGWNLYRKRLLSRELAEVVGAGPTTQMMATAIGESRPRTRLEILIDLDQTVQWLAVWSNDSDMAEEARKVQTQLAEAYKQ